MKDGMIRLGGKGSGLDAVTRLTGIWRAAAARSSDGVEVWIVTKTEEK